MAARRRAASPDRDQQPGATGAQSKAARISRLGEKGGADVDSRVDQTAGRRTAGDAGLVFGTAPGPVGARKTSARRAASDQSGARREERRQRGDHEPASDPEHHDQRGRSSPDAIDSFRPPAQKRVQAGGQSGQHPRIETRFRLRFEARLSHRLSRQMSAPACAPRPCFTCPASS